MGYDPCNRTKKETDGMDSNGSNSVRFIPFVEKDCRLPKEMGFHILLIVDRCFVRVHGR